MEESHRQKAPLKGALVLAAGYSRRFGGSKLTAILPNGTTVLQQTLQRVSAAAERVVVVTRSELMEEGIFDTGACHVASRHPDDGVDSPIRIVLYDESHLGMGHTLAFGASCIAGWDACLVCLGDMPFIRTSTYQQLFASLRPDRIVLPEYEGDTGNPVGFGSQFFGELQQTEGDMGGRDVLRAHQDKVVREQVTDGAVLQDIDTPDDLQRFR
jgi:molybdenum cofactor cytidylyltransferase